MNELLIKMGGVYNIILIVFHLMFWHLFNWSEDLRSLTFLNRAVMQVLNISITIIFLIFSYVSFVHTEELIQTPLGNTLLILLAAFWLARAVQQVVFFKLARWGSWAFMIFFLFGALLYGIPAINIAISQT